MSSPSKQEILAELNEASLFALPITLPALFGRVMVLSHAVRLLFEDESTEAAAERKAVSVFAFGVCQHCSSTMYQLRYRCGTPRWLHALSGKHSCCTLSDGEPRSDSIREVVPE